MPINHKSIAEQLHSLRQNSPLVHNITNYVVMNNTANALLSVGASPVMAHAVEEVEEIAAISSSVVLNIGTLSEHWIRAMVKAGRKAKALGKPLVLDPVGAGASNLRTNTCQQLLDACTPDIIRGNASEIMALGQADVQTKGVDSTESSNAALETAKQLASTYQCVVIVSGAVDYITDGKQVAEVHNGSALMAKVTGMGCTATAIVGAFAGTTPSNLFEASVAAMAVMGVAGDMAAAQAQGPGSFQPAFLDALYHIGAEQLASAKISV